MDPKACFERMRDAMREGNHSEFVAAAGDLLVFLMMGAGYEMCGKPTPAQIDTLRQEFASLADVLEDNEVQDSIRNYGE